MTSTAAGDGAPVTRPAVRVVCIDPDDHVLLLRWRDPSDGHLVWEPPGGGVEPGERPYDAACRELREETGLDPSAIVAGDGLAWPRSYRWGGRWYAGVERFFLARMPRAEPVANLELDDRAVYAGHRWWPRTALPEIVPLLEPPDLDAVVDRLLAP